MEFLLLPMATGGNDQYRLLPLPHPPRSSGVHQCRREASLSGGRVGFVPLDLPFPPGQPRAGTAAFSHRGPSCWPALISDPSVDTARTSVMPCSQSGRNASWMTSLRIPTSRKTGLLSRMQFGEKNTSCKRRAGRRGKPFWRELSIVHKQ